MTLTKTAQSLYDEFATWEIIDCHEHLPPESVRVAQKVDVLTLFGHYCRTDLVTAGLAPEDYDRLMNNDLPLDLRWKIFRPHLDNIRHAVSWELELYANIPCLHRCPRRAEHYVRSGHASQEGGETEVEHDSFLRKCSYTYLTQPVELL